MNRSWVIGMGAVLAAGTMGELADTAVADAPVRSQGSCAVSEFWSATSPQDAWIPVGALGGTYPAGGTFSFSTNSLRGETPASLTVGAQLGVGSGTPLSVHKLPASVGAVTGATTRIVFRSGAAVNATSRVTNPLHEPARPELFATGWRVRATLYRTGCAAGTPVQQVRTRSIFLVQRRYVIGEGWVGTHTAAHPVYGHPWATQPLTNP